MQEKVRGKKPCGRDGGVTLYVTPKALEQIDEGEYDVIRTTYTKRGRGNGSALTVENMCISLSHDQKPIRCIDLRRCDRVEVKNVGMYSYRDMPAGLGKPPAVPAE